MERSLQAGRWRGGIRRVSVALATSAMCAVVVAGLVAGAASAHHGGFGRGDGFTRGVVPAAAGTVQVAPTNGATTFTIQTRDGSTVTIDVSSATTYLQRGVSDASLTSVAANDLVAVFGTVSGSTVSASQVVIKTAPSASGTTGASRAAAAGLVQGTPTASGFTLQTRAGTTETVVISSSTIYQERGLASPSLGSVAGGDFVVVFGTVSGASVTASKIVIGGAPRHRRFVIAGTVQGTPANDSFTITTPRRKRHRRCVRHDHLL